MARKGETPRDFRSEAERVRPRADKPSRSAKYIPTEEVKSNLTMGKRDADRGLAPDQPTGRKEPHQFIGAPPSHDQTPDTILRREILERLSIEPDVSTSQIGIQVQDGVVRLTGSVDTINTKFRVEELVKRVEGVSSIENDLTIRVGDTLEEFRRDADAARQREEFARATKYK